MERKTIINILFSTLIGDQRDPWHLMRSISLINQVLCQSAKHYIDLKSFRFLFEPSWKPSHKNVRILDKQQISAKKKINGYIVHFFDDDIAFPWRNFSFCPSICGAGMAHWWAGESTRLQPTRPGFDSRWVQLVVWVCCWLFSLPALRVLLRVFWFSFLHKNQNSKF